MASFKAQQITEFSVIQMFDLVNDISQYSQFLPGCTKSIILTNTPTMISAELTISLGPVTQEFATQNFITKPHSIHMTKLYGPFKKLDGIWQFTPLQSGSLISLNLEYEFNNPMLALILNPAFSRITQSMINAFVHRAQHIY
jgi:ribosome-associated toxin RatA of RatAB toxin-antitoxin module